MIEHSKIIRELSILLYLSEDGGHTIEEIAARFQLNSRSVYRYITTFKEVGFLVYKKGNRFFVGKESAFFKEISQLAYFSDEEAYLINQLIDNLDDTNQLKSNLRKKLASIYHNVAVADSIVNKSTSNKIRKIVDAIEHKRQIVLKDYASSRSATIRDRLVEPIRFSPNYVSVYCYDVESKENKIFTTKRFSEVIVTNRLWQYEDDHKSFKMDVFRCMGDNVYNVKLKLTMLAKNLMIEEYPMAEKYLRKNKADCWIFEGEVYSFLGVGRFVAGLINDVEVVKGKELKQYLRGYFANNPYNSK